MSRVFLQTIGNETHESVKQIPVEVGVGTMLDFLNMVGLVLRFVQSGSGEKTEVDNTDDEEFKQFMLKQGIRL